MCEEIIEIVTNNVPERKTGRNVNISSSSTKQNIKLFKESGGISAFNGQNSTSKLDTNDP